MSFRFLLAACLVLPLPAAAGVFVFNTINPVDRVTHPIGYTGEGGIITVSVCISPLSNNQSELEIPVANAVRTWNSKQAGTRNYTSGSDNNVPGNRFDVESVLIHELGHCVGLDHPHLDNTTSVPTSDRGYTRSNQGGNFQFDLDPGADGVQGTHLDERGDDINLNWYIKDVNDPFVMPEVVDQSTFTVRLGSLPDGHNFAANSNRKAAEALGYPDTQSVMAQGISAGTSVRTLVPDELTTLLFAHSGLDRQAGSADSYELVLDFRGIESDCDISIEMKGSSFAYCKVQASPIDARNVRLTSAHIQLGSASTFNWFFNDQSNEGRAPVAEPEEEPKSEQIFADVFDAG